MAGQRTAEVLPSQSSVLPAGRMFGLTAPSGCDMECVTSERW